MKWTTVSTRVRPCLRTLSAPLLSPVGTRSTPLPADPGPLPAARRLARRGPLRANAGDGVVDQRLGVNTFRNPHGEAVPQAIALIRSTDEEKQSQLKRLQNAVIRNENVFAVLMDAARVCSLGQITHALFEVGGQCRRSM